MRPPPTASSGATRNGSETCKFRSTSLSTSFDAPRSRIVHALGFSQSMKNEKYSSPIFLTCVGRDGAKWGGRFGRYDPESDSDSGSDSVTSKYLHPNPISDSLMSSVRLTIVAPHARARRLLSVLRNRLSAVMLCFTK